MSFSAMLGALRRLANTTTRTPTILLTPVHTAIHYPIGLRPELPIIASLRAANNLSVRTIGSASGNEKIYACEWPGCGQTSVSPANLKIHIRVHTGDRPYTCDYPGCGKKFVQKGHLKTHIRVHTGERPYACDYPGCGQAFKQIITLQYHKSVHSDERPYACDVPGCSAKYKRFYSMQRHKRNQHGEHDSTN
ncbi:hypothetical protein SARC_00233 [Sphaeroforma arctica JP610]|uniref:C2H2-type domain-containing protein n=1 Tax=Sphaeroforma arctica JP610 TaxID=667725 RepID=A0A0L0GF88_9EUKA|nr:hypothetical protein SARC_00233 [Sphaeroforma arctica JP610]KNC87662.1 hypothetical protein SARC_00233 [Sphaeroforma arctica JP610]|eukprot:XP_014161564.1 hypothetical protein SARC_00233 [Sphaeroforma arctica JP610]